MPRIMIAVEIDGRRVMADKADYVRAKARQLRGFGYESLTEADVARQLDLVLAGARNVAGGLTVIGMHMVDEVQPEKGGVAT